MSLTSLFGHLLLYCCSSFRSTDWEQFISGEVLPTKGKKARKTKLCDATLISWLQACLSCHFGGNCYETNRSFSASLNPRQQWEDTGLNPEGIARLLCESDGREHPPVLNISFVSPCAGDLPSTSPLDSELQNQTSRLSWHSIVYHWTPCRFAVSKREVPTRLRTRIHELLGMFVGATDAAMLTTGPGHRSWVIKKKANRADARPLNKIKDWGGESDFTVYSFSCLVTGPDFKNPATIKKHRKHSHW